MGARTRGRASIARGNSTSPDPGASLGEGGGEAGQQVGRLAEAAAGGDRARVDAQGLGGRELEVRLRQRQRAVAAGDGRAPQPRGAVRAQVLHRLPRQHAALAHGRRQLGQQAVRRAPPAVVQPRALAERRQARQQREDAAGVAQAVVPGRQHSASALAQGELEAGSRAEAAGEPRGARGLQAGGMGQGQLGGAADRPGGAAQAVPPLRAENPRLGAERAPRRGQRALVERAIQADAHLRDIAAAAMVLDHPVQQVVEVVHPRTRDQHRVTAARPPRSRRRPWWSGWPARRRRARARRPAPGAARARAARA